VDYIRLVSPVLGFSLYVDNIVIENILMRLNKVRKSGEHQYRACCPAHGSTGRTLSIKDASDRVLVHCFAGCLCEDILAAIDLTPRDLYKDALTPLEQARIKLSKLTDELSRVETTIIMFEQDVEKLGIRGVDCEKYGEYIQEKIDIQKHINNIKRKYLI